jgi:hypothetical protein
MKLSASATVAICISLTGCATERIIERPVPVKIPSLCLTACPYPDRIPATNGELAEDWRARGDALACYESRLQCVKEMTQP